MPEELGGAGASYREAAVVAEEIGRAIAPVPFLGSAVLATTALLDVWRGGEPGAAAAAGLLGELAAGTTTAALAVPFTTMPGGARPELTVRVGPPAEGDADGMYRLSGTVRGVADGLPADVLLLPADGVPHGLFLVAADAAGLTTGELTTGELTTGDSS